MTRELSRSCASSKTREEYRRDAARPNAASAWVIRHPGGLYFAGFGKPPESVKWTGTLADAKLFNATALSQAERYIERIKEKDSLYMGMRPVKVSIVEDSYES
jgi:hypothetical protein